MHPLVGVVIDVKREGARRQRRIQGAVVAEDHRRLREAVSDHVREMSIAVAIRYLLGRRALEQDRGRGGYQHHQPGPRSEQWQPLAAAGRGLCRWPRLAALLCPVEHGGRALDGHVRGPGDAERANPRRFRQVDRESQLGRAQAQRGILGERDLALDSSPIDECAVARAEVL